jgi:transglutaminase-like putative cysteine protease
MKYRVVHKTHYQYSKPVSLCYNLAHLKPRGDHRQTCHQHSISIDPVPVTFREQDDFFGNPVTYFCVQEPHQSLTITAVSEVEVQVSSSLLDAAYPIPWEGVRDSIMNSQQAMDMEARQYLIESPFVSLNEQMAKYAEVSFTPGRPVLEAVHDLMGRIHNEFEYDPHFSTIATPLSEVLEHRRGVCQDFAHLAIGCLIAMGIPSRYVSGYLETVPPPGQKKLQGADASHAWFSVYVPNQGWMDFDPTNNQVPMDQHIITAWGRDYGDVTPLKGIIFGGGDKHKLDVEVDVIALDKVPPSGQSQSQSQSSS